MIQHLNRLKDNSLSTVSDFIKSLESNIIKGQQISAQDAVALTRIEGANIYELIAAANRIRSFFRGAKVNLCSIINAKSGSCPENCSFCAQSAHFETQSPVFDMVAPEKIVDAAKKAKQMKSREFSIVTSGKSVENDAELDTLCDALTRIKEMGGLERCASLGIMDKASLLKLKAAGLQSFHHNLETARSFFPNICDTHEYDDDVNTVRMAKEIGFDVCCGGIIGLGESFEQRVELALTLRELDVDSIPINFINPIKGTAMQDQPTVAPMEGLKTIAIFRFILPGKSIVVSGGREVTFRDLQPMIFMAGANGCLIGDYLTTKGMDYQRVLQMINDLGLEPAD